MVFLPGRSWVASPAALLGLALGSGPACGGGGGGACVVVDVESCESDFEPTFANVWREVIEPSCSQPGAECHGERAAAGAGGGLVMADPDGAYDALVNRGFVVPGDAGCSAVVARLESDDASRRMPSGEEPLAEGLRCGVRRWIEAGAPR